MRSWRGSGPCGWPGSRNRVPTRWPPTTSGYSTQCSGASGASEPRTRLTCFAQRPQRRIGFHSDPVDADLHVDNCEPSLAGDDGIEVEFGDLG